MKNGKKGKLLTLKELLQECNPKTLCSHSVTSDSLALFIYRLLPEGHELIGLANFVQAVFFLSEGVE